MSTTVASVPVAGAPAGARIRGLSRFWVFQLAGWFAYFVAMTLSRLSLFPLRYMIVSKGVLALTGFLGSLVLWRLYRRLLRSEPGILRVVIVSVIASYGMAMLWTAVDNVADIPIAGALLDRRVVIDSVFRLFVGSVYNAFTLLAWSLLYFAVRHHDALQVERERSLRAEAMAQRARLETLRYQLNPHFLFNTLNAISTLVVEQRPDDASRMISRLSDFLRLTLSAPVVDEVPLAEEMHFVERYLEIEQVRFGDRLRMEIAVSPEAWNARVPHLVLQPIIENAIRHGIAPREAGGTVRIEASRVDHRLRISVTNDSAPAGGSAPAPERIGLSNIRERLTCLYGAGQRLDVESGAAQTRVILELPFEVPAPS
jgi:hypothetical protein